MATVLDYKREAIRVKVMKCDGTKTESKKFSIDPQITSYEVLLSLLVKAFDIKGRFSVRYKVVDDYGKEAYLLLLSDWDLDAAFLSASDPQLVLMIEIKPLEEIEEESPIASVEPRTAQGSLGFIMNHVEKTINNIFQKALNLTEDVQTIPVTTIAPPPLTDSEFRQLLDPIGEVIDSDHLRNVIYYRGVEPSLRKVVWKHILKVYPSGMSGKQRIDYMKMKSNEYYNLRDRWRELLKNGHMVGDLAYVTGMVRKDVLRTDRHHIFYAGSDDNKNIASLFNILTTYALNHPSVSYCQGMSDLASPLLVTMNDEAHAYICFCALMKRLAPNFLLDGITMTKRFQHLADGLQHYDPKFYQYLKSYQADDLLFCYRWLLLEMKREFAFEDALRMLEVMWSSLPPTTPEVELLLYEQEFMKSPSLLLSPRPKENAYTKICALRRAVNHGSLDEIGKKSIVNSRPYTSLDDSAFGKAQETSPKGQRIIKNLNEFLTLEKNKTTSSKVQSPSPTEEKASPDDSAEYYPMTTMPKELKLELENLKRHIFGDNANKSEDVFVWENPLENETSPELPNSKPLSSLKEYSNGNEAKSSLLERRRVTLEEISTPNESEKESPRSGPLPSPNEFGGGNPFLMFLCITVLKQHRDLIMRQGLDYNEMAMHFDRMVRRHDVNKVLNDARIMYASYLKLYNFSKRKQSDNV